MEVLLSRSSNHENQARRHDNDDKISEGGARGEKWNGEKRMETPRPTLECTEGLLTVLPCVASLLTPDEQIVRGFEGTGACFLLRDPTVLACDASHGDGWDPHQ